MTGGQFREFGVFAARDRPDKVFAQVVRSRGKYRTKVFPIGVDPSKILDWLVKVAPPQESWRERTRERGITWP